MECGISTVEQEFLAFIVMPNEMTVGEWIIAGALPQIRKGIDPTRTLTHQPDAPPIDAEFEEKKE